MKTILLILLGLTMPLSAQEGDPFADDPFADDDFDEQYGPLRYCPPKQIEILYQAYDIDLSQAAEILEARPQKFNGNELQAHLKSISTISKLAQWCARPGETANFSNAAGENPEDEGIPSPVGLRLEVEPSLGDHNYLADARIILHQTELLGESGTAYSQKISTSMSLPLGEFMLVGVTTPVLDGKVATNHRRFHLLRLQFDQALVDYGEAQYEILKKASKEVIEEFKNRTQK